MNNRKKNKDEESDTKRSPKLKNLKGHNDLSKKHALDGEKEPVKGADEARKRANEMHPDKVREMINAGRQAHLEKTGQTEQKYPINKRNKRKR